MKQRNNGVKPAKQNRSLRGQGFTIVEMLVTVVLVSILVSAAFPMAELAVQRDKERELKRNLRTIRDALDAYKQASDDGRVMRKAGQSGYPPTLQALQQGVPNAKDPDGAPIYFLRRIPRDPFSVKDAVQGPADDWGKRSYASAAAEPKEGDDVYDVYSLAAGAGMNGVSYREW